MNTELGWPAGTLVSRLTAALRQMQSPPGGLGNKGVPGPALGVRRVGSSHFWAVMRHLGPTGATVPPGWGEDWPQAAGGSASSATLCMILLPSVPTSVATAPNADEVL